MAKTVVITLPVGARTTGTVLRWRQLSHSGSGYDEWAIDHIRITGQGNDRHHMLQFGLNMGCGVPYPQMTAAYDVRLEYSTDFGTTWGLVQSSCLPSSGDCTQTLVNIPDNGAPSFI